jgi:cytochrome d ubiquinol oxidase subunit II
MINVVAFCLIAGMLSVYTLLDGYDLGAGAISLMIAKSRSERSAIFESIGPFWSGNEVWLVAAGGTLFALFPQAYAVSFSGFYLPFILVLWLLMVRGISIELRELIPGKVWLDFWDTAFAISSFLLILLLGVALGNLVRGLSLDSDGYFTGTFSSLLNPYAIAVGILAVVGLLQHGIAYIADNIEGPLGERALRLIKRVWWLVLVTYVAVSAATVVLHRTQGAAAPIAVTASTVALLALLALRYRAVPGQAAWPFRLSFVFLGGLLVAASATMYPYLIRPLPGTAHGLTIFAASRPSAGLAISLAVALAGLIVVAGYSLFIRRRMSKRAAADQIGAHDAVR